MRILKRNYTQLERCILETAHGQFFIDRTILLDKVLEKAGNTGITKADVEISLQKLTEQKALSLHTCYALEDRSITNEILLRTAKILTPIVILLAVLVQIYFCYIR
jgi:hypothetical protein